MSKKGFKRMQDYMQASDLNDDGVVNLASAILREQALELERATRRAAAHPSRDNLAHRDAVLSFYSSEWFSVLTLGVIDGKEAATRIMKSALRGTRINL